MDLVQQLRDALDFVRQLFFGKRVVFIGQAGSGKSTFHQFISTGQLKRDHEPTVNPVIQEVPLNAPEGWTRVIDSVGATHAHPRWEDHVKTCDVLLYFVHANRLTDMHEHDKYSHRVNNDCDILYKWLQGKFPQCCIVVTHLDRCSETQKRKLDENPDLLRLAGALGGSKKVKCIKGRLDNRDGAAELLHQLKDVWSKLS